MSDNDIALPNFQLPFHCDHINQLGGGIAIYVREGFNAIIRSDISINGLEALWIELTVCRCTILIGGFYHPPGANKDYWTFIEQSIDQAFSLPSDNIVGTGDFNMNKHQTI